MRTSILALFLSLLFALTVPAHTQEATTGAPTFQVYSKYDFVPGEKIIGYEDFTQDAIGDFPANWNTNASGEIVTIAGKPGRWLKISGGGFFIPEFASPLPKNFTFEVDLLTTPMYSGWRLYISLVELNDVPAAWQTVDNRFTFAVLPGAEGNTGFSTMEPRQEGVGVAEVDAPIKFQRDGNSVHVSVWRQNARVRVYFNEDKVWDVPRALLPAASYNRIIFFVEGVDPEAEYFLANLRLAVGAADTRNKLLTEGKWVTHGILFDVNSDRVKAESYGTLREIANVLKENADVKVRVVGHTDADGDAAQNLDLSRRRAASVKAALAKEFAIEETRMDTDGKGETEPVDSNNTPAGKANNRRVEFVRK